MSELVEFIVIGKNVEGSAPVCDIDVWYDPYVSTRHCRIEKWSDGRMFIYDLGSLNGTWINDVRITAARVLSSGDRLRVGRTEVVIPPLEMGA